MEIIPNVIYSSPVPNRVSPVKIFHDHRIDETPQKNLIRLSQNNPFASKISYSEGKRPPISIFSRVKSHSTERPKESDAENSVITKVLFDENSFSDIRSHSREVSNSLKYAFNEKYKENEIKQLNSRIKSLIKEKSEIRNKLYGQNQYIFELQQKNRTKARLINLSDACVENSMLEVTFKPQKNFEDVHKHKRFPREVFRLPKSKGPQ